MKVLHTSDWHLGRTLYHKKRHEEAAAFLDWLLKILRNEHVDTLLIAGDIFDTTTPGTRAQELYYGFLGQVILTGCRHVVITGGNHDSPGFLNAPGAILSALNIHVVGSAEENPADEVVEIRDQMNRLQAIVCAVPFLRDRDVRLVEADEDQGDKSEKLLQGIINHYQEVSAAAKKLKEGADEIPVIGMGHLFTKLGKTMEGDGVRELYIGTIGHVDTAAISKEFDYMALGHLHAAQKAGGLDHVRYPGSPIPMSFAEAGQEKKVILVEFLANNPEIREITVPCFRKLVALSGSVDELTTKLEALVDSKDEAWVELEINGGFSGLNIMEHFKALTEGSTLEILRIKNQLLMDRTLGKADDSDTLENLDPSLVFERCLEAFTVPDSERSLLTDTYREALHLLETNETDAV
jgi:exonuclease SbcD